VAVRYGRFPRNIAILLLCLLTPALFAEAEEVWKKKPSEWTAKDAERILRKSPWAREYQVAHPPYRRGVETRTTITFPSGVPPPRDAARYTWITAIYLVRWNSAEPVVQAFARLEELGEQARAEFLGPPARLPSDRYVISVKMTGSPDDFVLPDFFQDMSEAELVQRAQLKTRIGTVGPLEVQRRGEGYNTALHFYFPRTYKGKQLLPWDGEVEPVEFQVKGKMFTLKSNFQLPAKFAD